MIVLSGGSFFSLWTEELLPRPAPPQVGAVAASVPTEVAALTELGFGFPVGDFLTKALARSISGQVQV